ncbi:MAG: hypothetical protein RIR26_2229 [Pseudomonadota bacterium]|jgi:hypothetical protein
MGRLSCFVLLGLLNSLFLVPTEAVAQPSKKRNEKKHSVAKPVRDLIDNEILTGMIENLASLNEWRLCESILQEHLKNKPNDPHVLLLLSAVYSSWQKFPQSQQTLAQAKKHANANTNAAFMQYQTALLFAHDKRTEESLAILKALGEDSSLKVTAKANRAIAELKANPDAPLPPWLERKHVSRSELNALAREKMKKAQAEADSTEVESVKIGKEDMSQVALNGSVVRLGQISGVSGGNRWWPLIVSGSASINLGSTYDSNILQIPDKLAPLVSDKSGVVNSGSLQAAASSPFGPGLLSGSAAVSSSLNANQDASNLNSFNASNTLQWSTDESAEGYSWGVTNALNGSFMNIQGYKLYNWANSTSLLLAKRFNSVLSGDVSVNGGLQKFPGVAVNSVNDDRNGPTAGAGVNLSAALPDVTLGGGVSWSQQNAKGKNFKTNGATASLSASRPLQLLKSQIALSSTATRSAFPKAEQKRSDVLLNTSLNWGFAVTPISEKTKLSFTGAYQSSSSSLPDAAFKKYTLSAAVDHAF